MSRPLTEEEYSLALWMLTNGVPNAVNFIEQLNKSKILNRKCPCGCASFDFEIEGRSDEAPGIHVLGDFLFGSAEKLCGVFIFEKGGWLSGVEVYGLAGDAPSTLPSPSELRSFNE